MASLLPEMLHRQALRIAHRLRKLWWRLAQPRLTGCRVLALDESGRVLLVRHFYGSGRWSLPGGGVGRNEQPLAAAIRELGEETGCSLDDVLVLEPVLEMLSGAENLVHIVAGRCCADDLRIDGREIVEARSFALDDLPSDLARNLIGQIPSWVSQYQAYSKESCGSGAPPSSSPSSSP